MAGRNCGNSKCREDFLRNRLGNFLADRVPEFSVISLFIDFSDFAKGTAINWGTKGLVAGLPWVAGRIATTSGHNWMAYPGMTGAAMDAPETGAFWTATAATAAEAIVVGVAVISTVSTAADAYARWECRHVQ